MNNLILVSVLLLVGAGVVYLIVRGAMKEIKENPIKKKKQWQPK